MEGEDECVFLCQDAGYWTPTFNLSNPVKVSKQNEAAEIKIMDFKRKTELLVSGNLEVASHLIISYVNQDTSFLSDTLRDFCMKKGLETGVYVANTKGRRKNDCQENETGKGVVP